ncbi:glycosyl hydrolase family 25 [Tamaricihabitans halophyticus]|uniref:Glycosyl hydrolase family 25 n=1 Tax=Tamaricihabitans halophyticus TaxID=1262583 RepID=A0A4R2R3H2_9PSEU|nr:glycoside hydrolase family 25 protein [Tamaricihabitans halophyticus]TCP57113.1 glycosyl hydrolase family 25 [Tamaricihabitans halophyticus]
MTDYGIDVSHWNAVDDWNAVRGNNITYSIAKVTESTEHVDSAVGSHVNGARGAGIATGGYHFARPVDVAAQVAHFANNLNQHGLLNAGSIWPALDMEAEGFGDANAFIRDFRDQFRARTNTNGLLVYANLNWFQNILRPDEWADDGVLLWIARYNGDPGNPGWAHPRLAIHQHSSEGQVPGIPGPIDRNATVGEYTRGHFTS